jgi:hypothetical protein
MSARPTSDTITDLLEPLAPRLEEAMGHLDFPFYHIPVELRMRVQGACGIVSETLRQEFEDHGFESQLLIRDMESVTYPVQHVIATVEGHEGLIIVDGSFSQLLEPYGPSWLEAEKDPNHRERFPEERVLLFRDGEQSEVAEWLALVCRWATGGSAAGAEAHYREVWDLTAYRQYEAVPEIREDAAMLRRQLKLQLSYN